MQYFNNNFWRMSTGFIAVVVIALGFLYLSQFYGTPDTTSPENYLAGQEDNN